MLKDRLKVEWKEVIYQIMSETMHVCTTYGVGEAVINLWSGDLVKGELGRKTGLRRLLSLSGFKGLDGDRALMKMRKYISTYLNILVDEGKIECMDTHTKLRTVYYIRQFEDEVIPYILMQLEQKGNRILYQMIRYFKKHDTASYRDIRIYLRKNKVAFTKERIKNAILVLEKLKVLDRKQFKEWDDRGRVVVIHKKGLSYDTIEGKAERILRDEFREAKKASEIGRDWEKKISLFLQSKGIDSWNPSSNIYDIDWYLDEKRKKRPNHWRREIDRVWKINIHPFNDKTSIEVFIILESKMGSARKISRTEFDRFLYVLDSIYPRRNKLGIMLTRTEPTKTIKTLCKQHGIALLTKEVIK